MLEEKALDENLKTYIAEQTPRRVKVYLLEGEDWLDNGTGYCIGEIEEDSHKPCFVVKNEAKSDEIILKSTLEGNIQYQRQQETLIVWTDLSGKDLALSFQETEGCAELCEFIIRIQQGNYSPNISLYYVVPNLSDGDDITELITGPVTYPDDLEIDNIESLQEIINQGLNSQFTRSCLLRFIVNELYFLQIIKVFNEAEREKKLGALYMLSDITKSLVLYNDSAFIEDILSSEEKLMGLLGILEYDNEYPNFKACNRMALKSKSFKTVIPVDRISVFERDFHLNFLKDVVFARFLDDQTFNFISSLIYMNQVEIINYVKDPKILKMLFKIYDGGDINLKRDGVRMLHQYVLIAKSLQTFQKLDFFSLLVKNGLFNMITFALMDLENIIRVLGTELIVIIIEHDVSLVNSVDNEEPIEIPQPPCGAAIDDESDVQMLGNFNFKLSNDMTLVSVLTKLLLGDKNPSLKGQAFEALKTLLSSRIVSNSHSPSSDFENEVNKGEDNSNTSEDSDDITTTNYFKAFYRKVAPELFNGIINLADSHKDNIQGKIKDDQLLYQHLCDLITFCCKEHDTQMSQPFFIDNNIILGVARLMNPAFRVTVNLSALRCLKSIVILNDNIYSQYIINNDILKYFFDFFESIVDEDNLPNSACLDFIENIIYSCDVNISKRHNYKLLATNIYKNYKEFCDLKISYVKTGKSLIRLVENGFYENANNSSTKNDTSFDSDDDFVTQHNASTPVGEIEIEDSNFMNEKVVTSPKPVNLFEHIEKDMGPLSTDEQLSSEVPNIKGTYDNEEDAMSEHNQRKRLASGLKSKFSSASKKIASSLR
ncbi:uncharacterized protein PRCAT00000064001 [Priceomyces carsonii]|uniref:uncharacterized protein n=1 Tax=Priceomyces carsonii TaxID=28549 RepID=UPI002ED916C7|nr:unnamed protein product [Priceomyces carsonii]